MSKHDEGTTFMYDVSSHTLLCGYCGYCETIEDKNFKCQTLMKVMHF